MTDHQRNLDPALFRGLTQGGWAGGTCCGSSVPWAAPRRSAACGGIKAQGEKADTSSKAIEKYWSAQKDTGELTWANWPLYLDTEGKAKHPTLEAFEEEERHQGQVCPEAIQDNGPFFAKVQPHALRPASTAGTTSP